MALDSLPGTIVTSTRDEEKRRLIRDFSLRAPPGTATGPGSQPDIEASAIADALMPIYSNAVVLGNQTTIDNARGDFLTRRCAAEGIDRESAAPSSGSVTITASTGGTSLISGDELKDLKGTGLRFQVTATGLYFSGDQVPIAGIDVGPATNLPGGTVLTFSAPRPGCGPNTTVVTQANGQGLDGGREAETDQQLIVRTKLAKRERPASGNDAEYQATAEATPLIAIEKAFTYPAILGPGTTAVVFTILASSGASRRPTTTEVAAVQAWLVGHMPANDSIFVGQLLSQSVDTAFRVDWTPGAGGWVDAVPWPPYAPVTSTPSVLSAYEVASSPTPTATVFKIQTHNGYYTAPPVTAPSAGQTIGFYEASTQTFVRKRILSIAGSGPWTITCDTTNQASDTSYVPYAGQRACPWADSINDIAAPVVAYFQTLGPGEQTDRFVDPGIRQKRQPESPASFPSVISNRILRSLFDLPSVEDITFLDGFGTATAIGTPGVASYLIELGNIAVFALS